MGVDSKKAPAPPLPAPTETESTNTTPTELATELATDVSKPADEKSSYSLPEDGTPVTIKTRGHKSNRSQTSLLIEYFEGGKPSAAGGSSGERKPSVRVRLTPSKHRKDDRIQITETKSSSGRKASLTRRQTPLTPTALKAESESLSALSGEGDADAKSMSSYASATEESNVSRNPIEVEIDRRGHRRRRPASPLIPAADSSKASYQPGNMSDISAIPTDSFLDGSGPSTKLGEGRRSKSPSRGGDLLAGAAAGLATAAVADKMRDKSRSREKDRVVVNKSRDKDKSDRKHKSKSRTSSISEQYTEGTKSPRRRSSKGNQESVVSAADSSVLSSAVSPSHRSYDQHSIRSGASKSSINNPKLLETVEDAIRRLILPELNALKREQSKHKDRRGSVTSSGTSVSREDYASDRRQPEDDRSIEKSRYSLKSKDKRDREARHELFESPAPSLGHESYEESLHEVDQTPARSHDKLKAAAAGAALGGLAATALNEKSPAGAREQRRRRRAELKGRGYSEEFEDSEYHEPAPPMPLMSEINPSEVTRTSILSAETDRPHSASEELTPVQEVSRGTLSVDSNSPTPTRTPITLQTGLGTQHANISHGDLKALPRRRAGDYAEENYEVHEYGEPSGFHPPEEYDEDEYDEPVAAQYGDYYNTQDVPPPLKYTPYQPERRGLSPIPSVSGYTEGGSEPPNRDSRLTQTGSFSSPEKSPHHDLGRQSPSSVPSNMRSREFDQDDRSLRSSGVDYRNSAFTEGSELDHTASEQAVRTVGTNPNLVIPPIGVESHVASLVDGSMLDESVLTGESGYGGHQYGHRGSMATLDEERSHGNHTPSQRSYDSQRHYAEERDISPMSAEHQRSREFEEYDLDEAGHKVPRSTRRYQESPTSSEAAITGAAALAAAAALKAAKDRGKQRSVEEQEWIGEGVQRNKSFKDRTKDGHLPANTPTHSVDRLVDEYEHPKVGHSGLPDVNDPMPEIGFGYDDDLETNPSVVGQRLDTSYNDKDHWHEEQTPTQERFADYEPEQLEVQQKGNGHGIGPMEAAGAAAVATAAALASAHHSRQPSQEHDEDWHRTSDDRKRDTLITNPYEGASPIVNLPGLNDIPMGGAAEFGSNPYVADYGTRSPLGPKIDEGYISQGPNKTPEIQGKGKGVEFSQEPNLGGVEDPFYTPKHARHMSGLSQGMGSPMYDAATGAGIDRIESKDIIALMQHLMVRDAQRSARDTEILVTLVRSAAEMRNSFEDIKRMLADTEDVIITEVKENTEKTVQRAIGGPRPFPGSGARSLAGGASQAGTDDLRAKKQNLFRRALKGLSAKGDKDLGRIEEMLMQLLTEVDTLKAQTAPGGSGSNQAGQSFENIQPAIQYEQDRGYEPEGNAGTSTASHASQSGHLSIPQSRGPSTKLGYERKFSDHRISTVPEANEDDDYYEEDHNDTHLSNPEMLLDPGHNVQRGSSVPLGTPPQPAAGVQASLSNENTPRTEKGKKHKSTSSSSWFPKISRWSETTTSSVGRVFRGSKNNDGGDFHNPPSRSGSDLANYDDYDRTDPYGEDKLHTGFSQPDLQYVEDGHASPIHEQPPPPTTYMTPEDPKYKAHRNSVNLMHPQPRPGQTERFRNTLENQAQDFDSPMSPKSADWAGSATSLHRFPGQNTHRYSNGSAGTGGIAAADEQYYYSSPAPGASSQGPPRPPKEPLEGHRQTPPKSNRISKLQKASPLPYHSVESGYGTATHGAPSASYTGSPKLENRNLSGAHLGVPTRRPSGPRAMTPKSDRSVGSQGDEAEADARRRKRDTFGTVASQESETF